MARHHGIVCGRCAQLQAKIKGHKHHIKLLQDCDDTSTKVIGEMDDEIERLQAENLRLNTIIDNRAEDLEVKAKYDKLQAKVERLEEELEKHRWIPVSERLPEENELVLLWIRNPKSISSGSLDVYRTGFNVGVGNTFYPLKFITHWKPIILPEQALKANKDGKEER